MSKEPSSSHPVAVRRKARGWNQEMLASHAGLPRSSVSAIEAGRLTPSVAAALAVARALECSVEELFGHGEKWSPQGPEWAWRPVFETSRYWEAQVGGRRLLYPAEGLSPAAGAHDGLSRSGVLHEGTERRAEQTLVMAGCDPAAGMLASEYARTSGFRLLVFSRGGSQALELLKTGAVHVAALHRATEEQPERNAETAAERLGGGYRLLRSADWQEGIVLPVENADRSVAACMKKVRQWAMREKGSAARECLDELLGKASSPETDRSDQTRFDERDGNWRAPLVSSHAAVAEAVRGGWADAGVCVRLCAEEAGLRFLPVRNESLDLCFAAAIEHDPRIQALIRLLRSRAYRRLIDELPGYNARLTGEMRGI